MYYRTSGPWGPGTGANLTAPEFDSNNWQLVQMVNAKAAQGVGISSLSVVGDELWVTLTDHTILGPYMLPVVSIVFVGAWTPSTRYYVNNILTANGATYIVTFNHVSAATFDPGANDGSGNDYYALLLADPANALPPGGAPGQVLEKATITDFSVLWAWPTLAGLHDVQPSPAPVSGQLVQWQSGSFGYVNPSTLSTAPQSLRSLADVLPSPAPTDGQAVVWSATAHAFTYGAGGGGGGALAFTDLTDVLASPAPTFGQIVYWNGSAFTYETVTTGLLTDYNLSGLAQFDIVYWDASNLQWRNRQAPPIYNSGVAGSFTLFLNHAQNLLDINPGGVITIPTNASIAFAKGTAIWIRQAGSTSSPFAVAPASGVTLNIPAGRIAQPRAVGSIVLLQQTSTFDTWEISGDLAYAIGGGLALPSTGNFNVDTRGNDADVFPWTPAGSQTVGAISGSTQAGKRMTFVITTSGTTSWTLTFSTNFKSQGPLSTGIVSGKVFVISFIGDGANFNELSRTTAM